MRILPDDEIRDILQLAELTDALESATQELGDQHAASTVRVRSVAGGVMASAMAGVWPRGEVAGGKLYSTKDGVSTFVVVLFNLQGELLAVMEGDQLTRMRTAAGTGVALRHLLAAPPAVATLIGTGRQCQRHLEILAQELPGLEQLHLVGRNPAKLEAAVLAARRLGLPADGSSDPVAAVENAGLVITLTNASDPLFPAERLRPDALVCALGATKADRVEIGPDITASATTIVVDDLAGSQLECGDLLAAQRAGVFVWDQAVELAEVVASAGAMATQPGVVLFESQGIALQDVVAGGVALRHLR